MGGRSLGDRSMELMIRNEHANHLTNLLMLQMQDSKKVQRELETLTVEFFLEDVESLEEENGREEQSEENEESWDEEEEGHMDVEGSGTI